jgi:hypothetical protein
MPLYILLNILNAEALKISIMEKNNPSYSIHKNGFYTNSFIIIV